MLSNLRNKVYGSTKLRKGIIITGILIFILNILFPVEPGPILLGDFIPCLNIFVLVGYFYIKFSKNDFAISLDKKTDTLGYITLSVLAVHLVFPQLVLL